MFQHQGEPLDSEAEAAMPQHDRLNSEFGNSGTANHTLLFGNQSRVEADSSTVTSNDNSFIDEILESRENNEAEADAVESIANNQVQENYDEVAEEEASGSNIADNDTHNSNQEEINPYAYLNRDEFCSERFKIELKGLPKYYGYGQLKKLLNDKLQLKAHKIKPLQSSGCAFVNFRCEEDKLQALQSINGYVWKKGTLSAVAARPAQDPLIRKRSYQQAIGEDDDSEVKESAKEMVRKATAPWSDIPYEEQLERKMGLVNDVVKLIYRGIANVNSHVLANIEYPVESILPSPTKRGYRNKCEFSIGYNPDTSEKTVGFRTSSYKRGSTTVGPVDDLTHIPKIMVDVVNSFQNFIRTSEPDFDPYDPETHNGLWKQLTVRVSQTNQVLVVLLISGRHLDQEMLSNIKLAIKEYYSSDPIISTFLIKVTEFSGEAERNKPDIIFGDGYITEELLGLKFRVSAEAFFQVNTTAAEVLYSTIKSVAGIDDSTSLLDVCCGTGTIGLCLANECSQVIGIEINEDSVSDAKVNAALNGLELKCRFYASKAENVLEAICGMVSFEKMVAIVDPPRAGLHNKVIHTLRRNEKFQKLVYISCDPKAALKNFIDLSRPVSKNYKGEPFYPTKFIPVDLFPDSPHYELIIVFERMPANNRVKSENSSN